MLSLILALTCAATFLHPCADEENRLSEPRPSNCEPKPGAHREYELLTQLLFGTDFVRQLQALQARNIQVERLFTGDSIAHIWGLLPESAGGYDWTNLSKERYTASVNTGIAGNTTCHFMRRLFAHVSAFGARKIFVHVGGNDLIERASPGEVTDNIRLLLRYLRLSNPGAVLVYGAIPPSIFAYGNEHKDAINLEIRELLPQLAPACVVDLTDILAVNGAPGMPITPRYMGDGLHFSPSVYPLYRERVEAAFRLESVPGVQCIR